MLWLCQSALGGCDLVYPEVVVVNKTAEHILIKNPSYNGWVWSAVLAYEDSTTPGRCLAGEDRVRFEKLDLEQHCEETGAGDGAASLSLSSEQPQPRWFPYQTVSVRQVDYGDFRVFELTLDDMEQDFSAPSPYGH
ncbi:MAG: hypothetical protein V2A73_04970 [Pseudomonadota bacterium]